MSFNERTKSQVDPVAHPIPVDELTLNISHELRTPLTAIQVALDLLGSGKLGNNLSTQERRMIEIAVNNAERLLRLTTAIEANPATQVHLLSAQELAQLRLEHDLKMALKRQEFRLHYQPIISVKTQQIIGFEALIRWQHPARGLVSPNDFIPLAESTGCINEIGQWVLHEACYQMRSWQRKFPDLFQDLVMGVNLSSKQLSSPSLVRQVEQVLQESGLAAQSLVLEVTESAMMESPGIANQTLQELQKSGIRIYIDDFGTGYSSLSRLYELSLDVLKIDRSFVQQLNTERGDYLVRAIINLARNLGIEVIAEGVETQEQLSKLQALGCDRVQGYFFSSPLDQQSITQLLCYSTSRSLCLN